MNSFEARGLTRDYKLLDGGWLLSFIAFVLGHCYLLVWFHFGITCWEKIY